MKTSFNAPVALVPLPVQAPALNLVHNPAAESFSGAHPRKHRRIDIKTYPWRQHPFALFYFSGPDFFNRTMRYIAGMM